MLVLPTASALDIYKVLSFPDRIIHQTAVKIKAQTINFIFKKNLEEGNSHSYFCTSGWKNSEADINNYQRVSLCSPCTPEQSSSLETEEMQDCIYSHCKHVHICSVANMWYRKTQELVAPPKSLLHLYSKTTPAMYTRNTALSVEVIYGYDFHKDIQDYQKTVLQIPIYKHSWGKKNKTKKHQQTCSRNKLGLRFH